MTRLPVTALVARRGEAYTAEDMADRLTWGLTTLGIDPDVDEAERGESPPGLSPVSSGHHVWELARPDDPDVPPREHRLLRYDPAEVRAWVRQQPCTITTNGKERP